MTKADPNSLVTFQMLEEAVDAILIGVGEMFKDQDKKYEKRFNKLETGVGEIRGDIRRLKENVLDLQVDTPTRKEFNLLKSRVDKYRPIS